MVKTHILHLPGVDNFRSLAGMPTLCGRRIAGHSLLRSDQLHRLTAASWQVLQRLGLKAVCDLRSAGERECIRAACRLRACNTFIWLSVMTCERTRASPRCRPKFGGGGRTAHDAGGVPKVARPTGRA